MKINQHTGLPHPLVHWYAIERVVSQTAQTKNLSNLWNFLLIYYSSLHLSLKTLGVILERI